MKFKKGIALLLSVLMITSMIGIHAFATESTDVAKNGTHVYKSLTEAINDAQDGDTITLLKDCAFDWDSAYQFKKSLTFTGNYTMTTDTYGFYISAEKTIKLDGCKLNMKNISYSHNGDGQVNWTAIIMGTKSKLLLDNEAILSISGGNKEAAIQGISTCGNAEVALDHKSKIYVKDCKEDAFERVDNNLNTKDKINVLNGSEIEVDHCRGAFINTFDITVTKSTVNVHDCTANASNGSNFYITDSTVSVTNSGTHGISASDFIVDQSTVISNKNGANGITVGGKMEVKNKSKIEIVENKCTISSKWTHPGALVVKSGGIIDKTCNVRIVNNQGSGISVLGGTFTMDAGVVSKNVAEKLTIGGGVYNKGTFIMNTGVSIYDNDASVAGDDLYNEDGATFTLQDTDTMDVTDPQSSVDITGWFYDGKKNAEDTPRWNVTEKPYYYEESADFTSVSQLTALKAAHPLEKYTVTVNYLDKSTNEKIAKSYTFEDYEGEKYDVTAYDKIKIEKYNYDSTTGDKLSDVFDKDKIINVWYSAVIEIEDPEPPLVNPDNNNKGDNNNQKDSNNLVKTGDNTNIALGLLLLALSFTVMTSFIRKKKNAR